MRRILRIFSLAMMALVTHAAAVLPSFAAEPVKVVYHLADGIEQASRAMGNIRNHLRAEPDTRIVVVANGDGIRFLLAGATERNGKSFDGAISALAAQGVEFRVCGNTLVAHDVPVSRLLPEVKVVTSGVVEVSRMQAREGFVYLRP